MLFYLNLFHITQASFDFSFLQNFAYLENLWNLQSVQLTTVAFAIWVNIDSQFLKDLGSTSVPYKISLYLLIREWKLKLFQQSLETEGLANLVFLQ